ncbi:MAG TPA: shikimate kinase [Planctomycetota bacterium]
MSQAIVLIGPRAAGKSHFGRRLAARLGWEFVDADPELERRHGHTIAAWLPADPEGFRAAEAALLADLLDRPATVLALGGGIVETPAAVARLAAWPRVWALTASVAELCARQRGAGRPALTDLPLEEEVAAILVRRGAAYATAASGRLVDTGGSEPAAWERLLAALGDLASPEAGGA